MHIWAVVERERKKMATFVQKPTTTNCYNNCHLLNLFPPNTHFFSKKYKYASLCVFVPKNTKENAQANFILMSFAFHFKLRCDERFTHAFTACGCVFKVITLVWANQGATQL